MDQQEEDLTPIQMVPGLEAGPQGILNIKFKKKIILYKGSATKVLFIFIFFPYLLIQKSSSSL